MLMMSSSTLRTLAVIVIGNAGAFNFPAITNIFTPPKTVGGFVDRSQKNNELQLLRTISNTGNGKNADIETQARVLSMVRHLLVQDWDLDDDGRPETLRLLFATPKRWLADGQAITVERAPTAFGEVSVTLTSHLAAGEIRAEVSLPARQNPTRTLLRARVPDGWRITKCSTPTGELPTDPRGTVDLTALRGGVSLRFQERKRGHALTLDTNASDVGAVAPPTRSAPPNVMTDTRRLPHLQPSPPSQTFEDKPKASHFAICTYVRVKARAGTSQRGAHLSTPCF